MWRGRSRSVLLITPPSRSINASIFAITILHPLPAAPALTKRSRQWRIEGFFFLGGGGGGTRTPLPPPARPGNNMITWKFDKIPGSMLPSLLLGLHLQLLATPPSKQSWLAGGMDWPLSNIVDHTTEQSWV